MKEACEQSARFHESLDPFAPAVFNVSWAGEKQSLNWFDTARGLTERWHHQQQIHLATNRPSLLEPELYHPVLDCFMRGLPYLYRDVEAPPGTLVLVQVSGQCGGCWFLSKGWQLLALHKLEARKPYCLLVERQRASATYAGSKLGDQCIRKGTASLL